MTNFEGEQLIRLCKPLVAVIVLGACAATPTNYRYQNLSTPTLWGELSRASDTRTLMLIEAELGARGVMNSGDEYIGRRTAGTVGRSAYVRTEPVSGDKNCSDFPSAGEAQRFFLAAGGPVRDPHGLDSDGDGNACEWGRSLQASVSHHRRIRAQQTRAVWAATKTRTVASSGRCYVGPRGGTYTITASGTKDYDGC